ncbi:terminase large subunit [Dielma fastidiosa]|uniref:terminase large subunit n=1 Tax=Dielma fastidiosa TaxID=1034346 RepID=UPI0023F2E09A|nr:terminase TerL endonuclease subunit [Dielma fastidiosa]
MTVYRNYLCEYREAIRRGHDDDGHQVICGQELILELDNLILDLDDPRYIYDTSSAYTRMDFMENCVRLTKAPFYNKPMQLMLWQKAFIEVIYSFKMAATGFDRFKKIVLLIARKNTKSETCSALGLTELFLGEEGNDIVCSSNDDNQASITYDAIDLMRQLIDPDDLDSKRNQRFIINKETNTKIFKLSDKTRNKEGRNIGFAIVDEVHEMKTNVIGKSIEQSQSLKDNPKFIIITTEGFVNGGYLDEELIKCRAIINGEDDGPMAERTLPWFYTQDSEQEVWQNESSWLKSNPTLGIVKKWDYLREQLDAARTSKSDRMFVLSKDFNFKQSNAQSWLQESEYKNVSTFELEKFRGCYCLGAVDLAETTDLTCAKILLMKPDDRTKYIHTMYFIPEEKLAKNNDAGSGAKYAEWAKVGLITIMPGVSNDLSKVADWFYKLYKDYEIRAYKVGYDVKFSKDFLSKMNFYGFECELIQQNAEVMSLPMKIVEAELKAKLINYNANEVDEWCFSNSAIQMDTKGQILCVKIAGQPGRKIDGSVTLIILYATLERYRSAFMSMINRR